MRQAADIPEEPTVPPTWDDFADYVLPSVGSPLLARQLERVAPSLTPEERAVWSDRFNDAEAAHLERLAVEADGWSAEEMDGVWYYEMKTLALDCIAAANAAH